MAVNNSFDNTENEIDLNKKKSITLKTVILEMKEHKYNFPLTIFLFLSCSLTFFFVLC